MLFTRVTFCLSLLLFGASFAASAEGVRLPQTRVIFHAADKSALAGIDNLGDKTYLVKASVVTEMNNPNARPAPFVVTPPLFRLEPQSQYTVRIMPQGTSSLPIDRESVLFLSFLAIPSVNPVAEPKAGSEEMAAQVSIGLQTVIKLFYRPEKLPMTVSEAERQLAAHEQSGRVVMTNPTPYYLTLDSLKQRGQPISLDVAGPMIAPYSTKTYTTMPGAAGPIQYTVINDFGGVSPVYTAKTPNKAATSGGKP